MAIETELLQETKLTGKLVTPAGALGYSELYLNFLAGKTSATQFYLSSDLKLTAQKLNQLNFDRDKTADILLRQNKLFGCGQKTIENIDSFRKQNTLCVFSGQQAGLLGGPMLVIQKAIGIIKAARLYARQLGTPVIPIFWIAGDDHDFEEANHSWFLNRDGDPCRIAYDSKPEFELPTSDQKFSDAESLKKTKDEIKALLGESEFTGKLFEIIDSAYTSDDTLVSAFGKFITSLLSEYGLVLFNPGDEEVKKIAAPLFKKIITDRDALQAKLADVNKKIIENNYHIQVEKKESSTHLFYNNNGRRPILFENGSYSAGDESFTLDELLALIDKHPERFSPDVMTRPILQSYLFPVLSQKGGPSEIAYFAQLNPLFEIFNLVPPVQKARPTTTIIEKRFQMQMEEYKLSFDDLTGDIEQAINTVLARTFPSNIEAKFEKLRHEVEDRFNNFTEETLNFDRSLENFAQQTFGKVDYAMKAFEGKVFSSHKKKSKDTRDRIYRVWHALFTNRSLQERSLNITVLIAKYGLPIIEFIFENLDSEESAHQLLYLSEMKN